MELKNFYNHINMCFNVVTRLQEDLIPDNQSVKSHFEFEKWLVPDCSYHYYSWNAQTYTSFGNSLLVELNNGTCVNISVEHQAYKVVNTHAHEISGLTF